MGIACGTAYRWKVTVPVTGDAVAGEGGGPLKKAVIFLALGPVNQSLIRMATGRKTSTVWPAMG